MNQVLKAKMIVKADHHWDWIEELLKLTGHPDSQLKLIEYIFKTAFLHGAKHAEEEIESRSETSSAFPNVYSNSMKGITEKQVFKEE